MSLILRTLAKCGKAITIEDRNVEINNGLVSEVFSNPINLMAIVRTVSGVSVFDDTNTETVATHKIRIGFNSDVTSEKWIKLGSKRIRIITVENCEEKDEVMILMCTERGLDSRAVNDA